ncbi:MAG: thioredoxin-disulfide reductase [Candidatus Kerfeldbacteria bacterium CG_4_10_14_0_8_um_filter_42_10]|uniref:Thioredoxin reductase n=1 Tax=Candidatus Kerfeldbacteria bacterium CG_4_10_14_0_8_um_filter_42_10 TaxID=2014248 RepID=A0A2M7RIY4_9BACT|nr:MAG: thioredoxin-disulfide reductase [Candidatus Kerfeldbacteria bacterium CG_4_10_14_0_8_um_filter_42_10]
MNKKEFDLIIIGAGASGLTAAIYAARRTLSTLVLAKDIGGQANLASHIENYPGFDPTSGFELMNKMKTQAEGFGAQFLLQEVKEINKQGTSFQIVTTQSEFSARAIILAFGLTPRDLGVPGEQEFKNKGVSYCVNCDGPLFKGKTVMVVGGGNSALDAAEYLSRITSQVYLIHRGDSFRGEHCLVERVEKMKNIKIFFNSEIAEIKGENKVTSALVKNNQTTQEQELSCDGVFVEVGYVAKTDLIKDLVELNERRQIKINRDCETSCPGIFAAGDITDIAYKQVVIAAGEGAKAALQVYKHLQQEKGKPIKVDWGR